MPKSTSEQPVQVFSALVQNGENDQVPKILPGEFDLGRVYVDGAIGRLHQDLSGLEGRHRHRGWGTPKTV